MTAAQKAAATGGKVSVKFGGATYEVPNGDEWDGDVLHFTDRGNISRALELLLGRKQYDKFRATKPKVKDYTALLTAIGEAAGTGNS